MSSCVLYIKKGGKKHWPDFLSFLVRSCVTQLSSESVNLLSKKMFIIFFFLLLFQIQFPAFHFGFIWLNQKGRTESITTSFIRTESLSLHDERWILLDKDVRSCPTCANRFSSKFLSGCQFQSTSTCRSLGKCNQFLSSFGAIDLHGSAAGRWRYNSLRSSQSGRLHQQLVGESSDGMANQSK